MKWWGWIGVWFIVWVIQSAFLSWCFEKFTDNHHENDDFAGAVLSFFLVLIESAIVAGVFNG